ncbi:MAG: signal peptidase I [Promicromonosporaceae bacterium]|nr:signal peptidase I [Promicromonosporaceae bacterium]
MAAAVAVILAAFLIPRIAGGDTFVIATGSMEPTLPVGTFVVIRPVETDDIEIGDIINFRRTPGATYTITHRVVGIDEYGNFTTRGDANPNDDGQLTTPDMVRGRLWYTIPWFGALATDHGTRMMALAAVGGVAALWFGYIAIRSAIEKRMRGGQRPSGCVCPCVCGGLPPNENSVDGESTTPDSRKGRNEADRPHRGSRARRHPARRGTRSRRAGSA